MLKALAREVITSRAFLQSWQRFRPAFPCILNLHRFAHPDGSGDPTGEAVSHDLLRAQLATLRKHGCNLVPLRDLVQSDSPIQSGRPTVAVTIDDGYEDFDTFGAPIFAEFDCPVTVFLISGFLDGTHWCWWDQLTYVLLSTRRQVLDVTISGTSMSVACRSSAERLDASRRINPMLERIPNEEKWDALERLAVEAEVEMPARPPHWCRPMSWNAVRSWAARGVRFGPHTVTHPILKKTSGETCRYEMEQSWKRLGDEVTEPEPIFAYPNGKRFAAGEREARIAADMGMVAALSTERRSLRPSDLDRSREGLDRYLLPRLAWPDSVQGLLQAVYGLDDAKRDWLGPRPSDAT